MKKKIVILGTLVLFASATFINNTLAGGTDGGQPVGKANVQSVESAYPEVLGQHALKPDKPPRPPDLDKDDKPPKPPKPEKLKPPKLDKDDKPPKPEKVKPPKLDKHDKPPKPDKSEKAAKPDKLPKPPPGQAK